MIQKLLLFYSELKIQVVITLSDHDIEKVERISRPSGVSRQISVSKLIKMWKSRSTPIEKIKVHVLCMHYDNMMYIIEA